MLGHGKQSNDQQNDKKEFKFANHLQNLKIQHSFCKTEFANYSQIERHFPASDSTRIFIFYLKRNV